MEGEMTDLHRAEHRGRAHEALARRLLFEIAFAIAWDRLERCGLPDADREDVAQEAVIAAWRQRGTYSEDRGNLEQWLSGILRLELLTFLRKRGRQPLPAPFDVPVE